MNITAKRTEDILQISFKGRLDTFGASKLDDALNKFIKKDDIHVIIDMKDVQYLGSGSIRAFLQVDEKLKKRGGDLHLCHINHYSLKVLEMTGLDDIFSIHHGKEEAI